ncbi:ATP-binding protein [Faecalibacterium prausnitzii]|uniref:Type IV secretion system DNA-binding domain-containing protein n=1 Tax=Faecalibacterium prausnitzii TaxID=853 RepID=A0A6A8KNS3_9FIRM|nr:type IV secretion system DNA-binding domain-containing protein [Faecalibacterium prausnitzii]MSC44788.1 type IV secretion system DNA-binding domain-containing protein [Faecalibacterium prausnitzii]MSC48142.1 type IV secretion system DNA-binding domain-containing protein [Faecalibacterium prausnitzii]MSC68215.1 type IV secretion system DNA-binding domain-containing protein [Faecalibacterium prausnitzii]MSC74550.1 type IV secretion system DNA-binding domain-containing protein [Faecalibacterium
MNDLQMTNQDLSQRQSMEELANQLTLADHLVYKKYLPELQSYSLVEPSEEMKETLDVKTCIKLFQMKELTLKKGEDMLQKLSTVYHSSMALGCSLAVMIDVPADGAPADIYLGVRQNPGRQSIDNRDLAISGDALEKGMKSNFPGSEVQELHQEEIDALLEDNNGSFGLAQSAIASVSCVAALRDKSKTEDKAFIQGIERFIDAMDGDAYTALFLAEPVTEETQAGIRNGYEELYSALSPFRKTTWSYTENESHAVMETFCSGTSDTVTDGTSSGFSDEQGRNTGFNFNAGMNQGTTNTIGQSHAVTRLRLPGKRTMVGVAAGASILALGAVAASAVFPPAGAAIVSAASTVGAAVKAGPLFGAVVPMVAGHETNGTAWSTARSIGKSLGFGMSRGYNTAHTDGSTVERSNAHSTNEQHSNGTTDTHGTVRTQQIEVCNKAVEELLTRIDEQIKRTKESEDYGCYSCAAYFLSSRPSKALLAANTYRSLMIGEGSSVESGAVNLWQDRASVTAMREYLKRFTHPVFARQLWENEADSLFYTAGTLVSGRELPMHLGLPTRSVHGLPIIEHAEFGRNVPDEAMPDEDKMNLGKIYHMGKEEAAGLILNRQAMASHTFITGSTGTGKSNAVYHLLDEITKNGQTTFLVVEPAKGEYKNVFGNCTDAQVFGTNPRETPLLRMNPFAFPENIHILEHIDRLVEIFNACWPMYAAMPAVLKDAIERSYQKVGWDLRNSESEKGVFPTFFDLLDILPGVIEESHYSKDTQSDYVGALCTRVKSLTNGIYGSVLCAEDALTDEALFDRNVIVDLSRVGSMETKSLLMGILVMKLQEYRMCSSGMNSRLRHVTVLEEAHNLLRKTSAEQSQEGANLQGKSVEMLANAIAEMRTYGEGFIIADQAPGLLDMSVIRNTNTKIILRLPDEEDRKLVGKSAALKEAQIDELSKLPLGVAAVYQNEWPEAVLCKIEAYPMPENAVYHKPSKMPHEINAEFVFGQLAVGKELEPLSSSEMEQLKLWLKRHETVLKPEDSRYLERVFAGGELDVAKTRKAVFDFFGGIGTVVDYCVAAEKSLTPRKEFLEQLQGQYGLKAAAADWVLNSVISMGMSLNPDAKAVDNLRTNFEQQGGRVL